jgi:hypothetical protein
MLRITDQGLAITHLEEDPSPAFSLQNGQSVRSQRDDETTASRFIAATIPGQCGIAPFTPLMYQPSIWENPSRSPSPFDDVHPSAMGTTDYVARAGILDDPISIGLVSDQAGSALYHL